MNKILLAHTSWYSEYIKKMIEISSKIIQEMGFSIDSIKAPGSLELAASAKSKILRNSAEYSGVLFLGIVVRGDTSHYDLVTNETFRCIGDLGMEFVDVAFINNVSYLFKLFLIFLFLKKGSPPIQPFKAKSFSFFNPEGLRF